MKKNIIFSSHIMVSFIGLFFSHSSIFAQVETRFKMLPVSEEAFYTMIQFFQYDRDIPLDARVVEKYETSDYIREKIVFLGTRDCRVPGYLAIPKKGPTPYPCVLQLHGQDAGGKSSWWRGDSAGPVTQALLASGFALFSLDAQYEGERKAYNDYESSIVFLKDGRFHKYRETVVQSTVDYRRAIDYLSTYKEIDINRIGVFGYSFGGIMTFLLTGVEPRIKVSVAAVTPLMGRGSPADNPNFANYHLSAVSPRNYARSVNNRPFLMLMGKKDFYYTVDEAEQVFELIDSQMKNLIFYDSGHQLPIDYIETTVKWFQEHL